MHSATFDFSNQAKILPKDEIRRSQWRQSYTIQAFQETSETPPHSCWLPNLCWDVNAIQRIPAALTERTASVGRLWREIGRAARADPPRLRKPAPRTSQNFRFGLHAIRFARCRLLLLDCSCLVHTSCLVIMRERERGRSSFIGDCKSSTQTLTEWNRCPTLITLRAYLRVRMLVHLQFVPSRGTLPALGAGVGAYPRVRELVYLQII